MPKKHRCLKKINSSCKVPNISGGHEKGLLDSNNTPSD